MVTRRIMHNQSQQIGDTIKYSLDDIIRFIIDRTGCDKEEVKAESDLQNDLGCSGDDFDELISEYSAKFKVDMSSYLWYFHSEEEGHSNSIGKILFKTPYERVKHIPITPALLLNSANHGKWLITYPEHSLPKRRYDILINQILVVTFVMFLLYKCSR